MNVAYLLIGGNMGDRALQLKSAADAISTQCGMIEATSPIYQTAAWGLTEQPNFLNQALKILTSLSPFQLLHSVLAVEESLGRVREQKFGPRTIDIDILLYNDLQLASPTLTIPHPSLPHRRFALVCLNDIAGDVVHPTLGKTINELLLQCTDSLRVDKFH
ncbi:MAG TPA: 2-amino-4-hydroxy-6-hydroxymethyldihydropteridine diphosphokinase [Chitinophagaceae bacterium]|jgi:2-amino-4-hydroxy-6-hydroxymethyldihydropteridine diphosphokinase|nr:2-amino-4-hydroxy-6-hydroxymethyldihydropteridine diphosphokinase [Chitinophagaceae bacterium]